MDVGERALRGHGGIALDVTVPSGVSSPAELPTKKLTSPASTTYANDAVVESEVGDGDLEVDGGRCAPDRASRERTTGARAPDG